MVCEAVEALPQLSVAVQVRVMLYVSAVEPGTVTSTEVSVKRLPQASVALGSAKAGSAGQFMTVGAGRAPNMGAVTSCTCMVCEALELFPQTSVAVQVRITLYIPAQAPGVVASS